MSRYLKSALCVGVCVLASGCENVLAVSRGIPVETQVVVADGAVVVAGPRGFCVDPKSTRTVGNVPFVVMGNCASISGDGRAPQPGIEAVLTATVATMDPSFAFNSSDPALPVFFEGAAGRAALSRAGNPQTVEVIDSFARGPVFYVHARDTSPGPVDNIDETHWRAVFGVNGRVVSASVLDFKGSAVSPERSLNVLTRFADRIRSQSVGRGREQEVRVAAVPAASIPVALGADLRPVPRPGSLPVAMPAPTIAPAGNRPVARPNAPGAPGANTPVFPPIGILRRLLGKCLWDSAVDDAASVVTALLASDTLS